MPELNSFSQKMKVLNTLHGASVKLIELFVDESDREPTRSLELPKKTGRRRAATSQTPTGGEPRHGRPSQNRAASFDAGRAAVPEDRQLRRKPVSQQAKRPSTMTRPVGKRRPSSKFVPSDPRIIKRFSSADEPDTGRRKRELEEHAQSPPCLPPRPPISPLASLWDLQLSLCGNDEPFDAIMIDQISSARGMDLTFRPPSRQTAIEKGWKWDELLCASSPDRRRSDLSPPPPKRPRKSSLRDILNRPSSCARPALSIGSPIEQPLTPGEPSPLDSGRRSAMEWDSSDEETPLRGKWRVSWGRNSLKKTKIAAILRRSSSD